MLSKTDPGSRNRNIYSIDIKSTFFQNKKMEESHFELIIEGMAVTVTVFKLKCSILAHRFKINFAYAENDADCVSVIIEVDS